MGPVTRWTRPVDARMFVIRFTSGDSALSKLKLKLLNINSHPGMITSDNNLTQLGLQFKKLN